MIKEMLILENIEISEREMLTISGGQSIYGSERDHLTLEQLNIERDVDIKVEVHWMY
jgi:hypothetical protein